MIGMLLFAAVQAESPTATIEVDVSHLRSAKGMIRACLTRNPRHFPDCKDDPLAITQSVPAASARLRFSGVQPGRYALTLFHDENGNLKLDTMAGIPREGFGFSRNPAIRFGPPKYSQVEFAAGPGLTRQLINVKYML